MPQSRNNGAENLSDFKSKHRLDEDLRIFTINMNRINPVIGPI